MERKLNFFIDNIKKVQACGSEITVYQGSTYAPLFEIEHTKSETHNLDNCENCRFSHEQIIIQIQKYHTTLPYCCDHHVKLINKSWFDIRVFKDLPKMVADKTLYSHHHILNNLDKENWKDEIIDYLEYVIESFGMFPNDCGEPVALSKYISFLIKLQEGFKLPKEVRKYEFRKKYVMNYIKSYLEPPARVEKDLGLLISIYDRWYTTFPFDIPLFSNLKNRFSKSIPILEEKPKYNPYLKISRAKLLTTDRLCEQLSNITHQILNTVDTTKL